MGTPRAFRNVESFNPITNGSTRKNPASIRRLLHDLIYHDFDRDAVKLADRLLKIVSGISEADRRDYHHGITSEKLYKATLDKSKLAYGHLEILARHFDIPTALMLLYTRIYSEFESSKMHTVGRSLSILEAFEGAIDEFRNILQTKREEDAPHLNYKDFSRVRDAYLEYFSRLL